MRWFWFGILACFGAIDVAAAKDRSPIVEQAFSDHAQAIEIGRGEFQKYWETRDPDNDYADYSAEERSEVWVETLEAFFAGVDDGGIEYMALYAPAFSEYLLAQIPPFSLSGELRNGIKLAQLDKGIAEENRKQAELAKQIAEENRKQAEGKRMQEALDRLIDAMSGKIRN